MPIFLNALLCGIIGAIAASLLGRMGYDYVYGRWGGTDLDIFILVVCTLPGLLWGLVVGAISGRLTAPPGWAKPSVVGLTVTLGAILVVVGGITALEYTSVQRTIPHEALLDGKKLRLEFELILPPGVDHPRDTADWDFVLQSGNPGAMGDQDTYPVEVNSVPIGQHEGRVVLQGRAPMATTTWKSLAVTRSYTDGSEHRYVTNLSLHQNGAVRRPELSWSPWSPLLSADEGTERWRSRLLNSRYRVQFASEP